ncbi:hypothetical protein QQZ08_009454 [Neonectria magnoliae]|uniref:Uncharacterized protein n=1 Tax=Neonectria magnoliae TaxID=2732573 RepID=A0ABR1HNE4_9HYPO
MLRVWILCISLWPGFSLGSLGLNLKKSSHQSLVDITNAKTGDFVPFEDGANLSAIPALENRGLSDLMERQSCNAGWHACDNGSCCRNGYNCVELGCCEGSSELCGTSKCYFPDTQICCEDSGQVCYQGDTCQSFGCCQDGAEKCGSRGCYDPDDSICCKDYSTYCPKGYDCVSGGDCCPSGQERCGNSKCYDPDTQTCCTGDGTVWACPKSDDCCSTGYCYDPDSEKCCDNGSCDGDTTCCENECCTDIAYCGSNGYCSRCPDETRTVTTTKSSTTVVVSTDTITEAPEETTGFSCEPITVTNSEDATLVLGEDCGLTYEPPETTTSSEDGSRLRARQASCKAPFTRTVTKTVTKPFTESSTTTTTITEAPSDLGFSCPPMEATNDVGDVLALDKDCSLSLSLVEPSTTASEEPSVTQTGASSSGSNPSDGDSASGPMLSPVVSARALALLWVLGFALL